MTKKSITNIIKAADKAIAEAAAVRADAEKGAADRAARRSPMTDNFNPFHVLGAKAAWAGKPESAIEEDLPYPTLDADFPGDLDDSQADSCLVEFRELQGEVDDQRKAWMIGYRVASPDGEIAARAEGEAAGHIARTDGVFAPNPYENQPNCNYLVAAWRDGFVTTCALIHR